MLWLLLLKPPVRVLLLQVLKYDNIKLKGTLRHRDLTSYLSMSAKHMYFQGKGESEKLLRLPKPLTLVLATKLSTYPLVTISRTEFRCTAIPKGSG